ncbi:hypothetical protein [Castellaniella sp.]|uniref:hypothetical protein n=1 Tax=Castellaniella sp. TaxID=1955812 RepID=UPI003C76695C
MLLSLDPTERNLPGEALLSIRKWGGADTNLQLTIQRNQDQYYLQADGSWNSPPYGFIIDQLEAHEDQWSIAVGPQVVDPLLAVNNATFMIQMQDADGHKEASVLRCARTLLGSSASGETVSPYAFGRLQAPPPAPVAPEPPPAPEPEPDPAPIPIPAPPVTPPAQPRSPLIMIVLLILLALIAGGAYWWWSQRNPAPADPAPVTEPAQEPAAEPAAVPAAAAPAAPCDLTDFQAQNELAFVKACATSNTGTDALLETIAQAKAAGYCGVAQRLYANRGQAGDSRIALAYAREYDPKFHQDNACFKEADPAIAVYWYEAVLDKDPDNALAKKRLQELPK